MNDLHHSLGHQTYLLARMLKYICDNCAWLLQAVFNHYLWHIAANHLFFQVMNKHCNLERKQFLNILIEEMANVTASSDEAKLCNISTSYSMQSNFSRLTNESLFSDRHAAESSAFNWYALLFQNMLSPSGWTRPTGCSISQKELKKANLAWQ